MTVGTVPCVGCGALVPDIDGPTHRYVGASPGCWAIFTELGARETVGLGIAGLERLSVHAYMVQHPGVPGPQSSQSVWAHLFVLCLVIERDWSIARAVLTMQRLLERSHGFHWLDPPASLGDLTVVDVASVETAEPYRAAVRRWAASAWAAWAPHHPTIRALADGHA